MCFKLGPMNANPSPTLPEIILPLDLDTPREAWRVIERIGGDLKWVKVGLQMYLRWGDGFVKELAKEGFSIFLDLKLYDIPNTVASAIRSIGDLPVALTTLHTLGGVPMMRAAVEARDRVAPHIRLLGVTILTSMDVATMNRVGIPGEVGYEVVRLAGLARESGVDGVVCSPQELGLLQAAGVGDLTFVTPGVRPADASADDQSRIMTPGEAVRAGARYLVIGRPITAAPDPAAAFRAINDEMLQASRA